MTTLASTLRRFRRSDDGSVAMIFGLSMIPMLMVAGAAVDYARAAREKAVLGAAIDATGLALAQDARRLDVHQHAIAGTTAVAAVVARPMPMRRHGDPPPALAITTLQRSSWA